MSQKHFVFDMDYIDDLACNIAENIPEEYHIKFLKELNEYLKCATFHYESSSDSDLSDVEEEYEVEKNEDGFYELTDCDVKDCNAVGTPEKNIPISK